MKAVSFSYSQKIYQRILAGFALFSLGVNPLINFNSAAIQTLLCCMGWLLIIANLYQIKSFFIPFVGTQRFLFILYLFLASIMIFRGYTIDYRFPWSSLQGAIRNHLSSPFYILPYFLPLFILIGIQRFEFKTFAKLNILFNTLFVPFFLLNIRTIYSIGSASLTGGLTEDANAGLAEYTAGFFVETSFFLLCKDFLSKNQWRFNLAIWVLATLTLAIGARRGQLLMMLLLGLSATFLYVQSFKGARKIFSIIGVIFIVLMLIGFYFYVENTLFAFLNDRGTSDTRSGVDKALLAQMNTFELWFGKGLNGRYFMPQFRDNLLGGWRYGSETGFYTLVLKGGYVLAIAYILVLLIPALKGIFKSNNSFTKALGLYIVLSIIELYPFGWPMFNIKFLIIWIGVAFCWNPVIRKMNNTDIKDTFFCYA
ncbi:MAG: hypothetical protein JXR36_16320 [Bacteroidales bacterium]|nr:hypothetical protein [Bacteroidales bacterium]